MVTSKDVEWFKKNFFGNIQAAVSGTVYPPDFVVAIACQESGEIWSVLRKKPALDLAAIVALCVGDTFDSDSKPPRKAFPASKSELFKHKDGDKMFDIARAGLIEMAKHIPGYEKVAKKDTKFCHGFGLFQYDLQHFKINPDFFLKEGFKNADECLALCLTELKAAAKRIKYDKKTSLSDLELCHVGIAYNSGGFNPKKGLKQGHKAGDRYYGENLYDYFMLAQATASPAAKAVLPPPKENAAILAAQTLVEGERQRYVVDTKISTLRVRSTPEIPANKTANIVAELPEGTIVQEITGKVVNKFLEIETNLGGAYIRGFSHTDYLDKVGSDEPVQETVVKAEPPKTGIVAAHLPVPSGTTAKRTEIAGAHSLTESSAPRRAGDTPAELTQSIADMIKWLDVANSGHKRYKPRSGLTFCNIYAHDYCDLAGVYLPRVWWMDKALIDLAKGKAVKPLYASTVFEARANDLFRWLRDHGPDFGWRQTGTLSKLQQAANQGGVGVIVARRKEEGKSGHITIIVPETDEHKAVRDSSGEVTRALESQAGASNFSYGHGKTKWWTDARFAEAAFHIHA